MISFIIRLLTDEELKDSYEKMMKNDHSSLLPQIEQEMCSRWGATYAHWEMNVLQNRLFGDDFEIEAEKDE